MQTKTTTLRTVAEQAGVSMKTVSRVVNNEPYVSEKMRIKVREAISELQFEPNMAARQLRGQRSYSLALIYEPPASEFLTQILEGILPVCREAAYRLLLEPLGAIEPRNHINKLIETRVADGFILLPPLSEDVSLIKSILEVGLKVVLIASTLNTNTLDVDVSKVGIDDYAAGRKMGRHLIEHGHKRIGYISLRGQHTMANERGSGLEDTMLAAGLSKANFMSATGDSTFKSGYEAALKLLKHDSPPTAIFAGNDYMAAGAIACAKDLNLCVPGDLSVAGFDGADLSKMFVPPFMTVEQPLQQFGRWAARQLLVELNTPNAPKKINILDFKFIPRNSVRHLKVQAH